MSFKGIFYLAPIIVGMLAVITVGVCANAAINQVNASVFDTIEENTTSVTSMGTNITALNNTLILNAKEVEGEKETYRWVNSAGEDNPSLELVSNTDYTFKINNPTDEEHELIIDSKSDGKTTEIAKGPEVKPGKNSEFQFKAEETGELGYHCKYHPDQMNGTITVS